MSSGASPGAILEEWTLDELRDAMEYERQYGVIGPERLDYLAAQISMYLARTASKKAPKSLDEYLLKWGGEETAGNMSDFRKAIGGGDG